MPTESILDSKILIVDDQAGVRESMKMVLDNLYQVLTAEDGIKCLDITQQNKIGLIMLDLTMPKMQGLEVLQHIKEIDYSIPVIIITGVRSHQSAIDALRMGATDFILKPFDATYLRHMVKETLKQAELEKDETEREKIKASLLPLEEISRDEYFHILDALHKTLEAKEPKVKGHAVNVADYVVSIARQLGYAEKTTRILKNTTLIHDIGKVGIDDKVLTKSGKLSQDEYQQIKRHPEIGSRLLAPLKLTHIDYTMILHHHEFFNGKGYPSGMAGKNIPVYARILAVADAFDAMISNRSYRKQYSIDQAKGELIAKMGTQFDPVIVETFIKVLEKNPAIIRQS